MAARNISGSIRKFSVNGLSLNVAADSNVSMPPSEYENSSIATSGANMRKMVKRVMEMDGLVVIVNSDEVAQLKVLSETMDSLTLSVTNAAGDTARNTGTINLDTHETEENRLTVKLIPDTNVWKISVGELSA